MCVGLGITIFVGGDEAIAANPACSSGFVTSVVHVTADDHFRGKACYRESTDNWQFQDTYADGWSINFYYRPDSLKGSDLGAGDWDGWNQKWKTQYSSYPEGQILRSTLCAYDYSADVSHGCTVTNSTIS